MARRGSQSNSSSTRTSYFEMGFGLGLGYIASLMIFILLAMLFFVPGYILLNREQKKPAAEQSQATKIIAFVLMGLGVVVGLGFGAGAFLGEIGEEV